MDFQFWLYLVIAIIYILSRALKKQEGNQQPPARPERPQRDSHSRPAEKPRQMTFEELLREITEAKEDRRPVIESPRSEVLDYDEQIEEEEQDLETVVDAEESRRRSNEAYNEARRQAFQRASLEETMSIKDTKVEFGKFGVFEKKKERNLLEEYTKDLHDPEGLKKAFVLSEILNRKF